MKDPKYLIVYEDDNLDTGYKDEFYEFFDNEQDFIDFIKNRSKQIVRVCKFEFVINYEKKLENERPRKNQTDSATTKKE